MTAKQDQVLSMAEAREKLMELEKHMPNSPNELVYDFGRFLAGRLNDELVPKGFVIACELALYDLQKGIDGFTHEPIQDGLVGYPPQIYDLLRLEFSRIAEAIFPEKFTTTVKEKT